MLPREDIVQEINTILASHNIPFVLTAGGIVITRSIITDSPISDSLLSRAVIDHIWPPISEMEVFHYTTRSTARLITSSGYLHLNSLTKRFWENEIKAFCVVHNLDGYLHRDASGEPKYKSLLMRDIYYISFAGTDVTDKQDDNLWSTFGAGDGARLRFRVKARNPDFRKMKYGDTSPQPIPILNDLARLAKKLNRYYIMQGISRLCAFYLPTQYCPENEYRMLYKKYPNLGPCVRWNGKHSYIRIPISQPNETGYDLTLLEIQTGDGKFDISNGFRVVKRK